MLKVPNRASVGNKAYAQKPAEPKSYGISDNRASYSVTCPYCKKPEGEHCVGADGFWILPHYSRRAAAGYEDIKWSVSCDTCGAPKGYPCLYVSGAHQGVVSPSHGLRVKAYREKCEASTT